MKTITVRDCTIGSGIPKLCVPIVARTMRDMFAQARALNIKQHDLVEWRVDYFEDALNPDMVRRASRVLRGILGDGPMIFTFRTKEEGGQAEISEADYLSLNMIAVTEHLTDMIDIELFRNPESIRQIVGGAKAMGMPVIISSHDFNGTPCEEDLISRMKKAEAAGADILKMAVMPHNSRDVLTLLSATERISSSSECPLISMSMGKLGVISRMCGEVFGSAITFGSVGYLSAPGQLGIDDLQHILTLLHSTT